MARECLVHIAYCIGKLEPEMVTVVTEEGTDLSDWVRARFALAPWDIIERFGLWRPNGWSYQETAEHGHYGYDHYPWEQVEPQEPVCVMVLAGAGSSAGKRSDGTAWSSGAMLRACSPAGRHRSRERRP